MNINEVYTSSSEYLKATDLKKPDGTFKAVQCVISSAEVAEFDKDDGKKEYKVVLGLKDKDKSVVLNKTNGLKLAGSYGAETDNWVGRDVIITASLKSFGGNTVPGIDVSAPLVVDTDDDIAAAAKADALTVAAGPDPDEDIPF